MCDQETGHCSCLPGVTGSDCSECKPRHVLRENYGCLNCEDEYCVVTLLDDFDMMHEKIGFADQEFEKVSASQFATRRLDRVNETIYNLSHAIDFLIASGTPQVMTTLNTEIDQFEKGFDRQFRIGGDHKKNSEDRLAAADKARSELVDIWRLLQEAKGNASNFKTNVGILDHYLRQGPGSKVTESAVIAEPILLALKNRRFDEYNINAIKARDLANESLGTAGAFQVSVGIIQLGHDISVANKCTMHASGIFCAFPEHI